MVAGSGLKGMLLYIVKKNIILKHRLVPLHCGWVFCFVFRRRTDMEGGRVVTQRELRLV